MPVQQLRLRFLPSTVCRRCHRFPYGTYGIRYAKVCGSEWLARSNDRVLAPSHFTSHLACSRPPTRPRPLVESSVMAPNEKTPLRGGQPRDQRKKRIAAIGSIVVIAIVGIVVWVSGGKSDAVAPVNSESSPAEATPLPVIEPVPEATTAAPNATEPEPTTAAPETTAPATITVVPETTAPAPETTSPAPETKAPETTQPAPTEATPAEADPVDAQPADAQPAETQPAETEAPTTQPPAATDATTQPPAAEDATTQPPPQK